MDADTIELGCERSIDDPAGYFGAWIDRGDVHRSSAPRGWAVVGHEAVRAAFRDAETLSADRVSVLERVAAERGDEFGAVVDILRGWMIFRDPPKHTDLRGPVGREFTPRRVHDLEPFVDEIVDASFERMDAAAEGGAVDVTTHVVRPVPAAVIGALLGLPEGDRHRLQEWSDDLASIVFSLDPRSSAPDAATAAAHSFAAFFGPLVDAPPPEGLIAALVDADSPLDRTELVSMCTMLLFAGHETTAGLMQQMAAVLTASAELRAEADAADPSRVVDEFLRVYGPARTMARKARLDHRRGGVDIRTGETVLCSIAAANHDPGVFDRPEVFDVHRDPNPHLGFGWGLHHCLGAQLAVLEARSFLRAFRQRFPAPEFVDEPPPLTGSVMGFHRGPVRLIR